MIRKVSLILLTASLAACGAKVSEINDAGMQSSAQSIGESTGEIATMDANADESTIESNVNVLGANISSLASQHFAYASINRFANPVLFDGLTAQEGFANLTLIDSNTITWDGTHLKGTYSFTDSTGGDAGYDYSVDMTFTNDGDSYVTDGTFSFDWNLGASLGIRYKIDAKYNKLTIDADGCAISGGFEVKYDYKLGGAAAIAGVAGALTNYHGTVKATFNGCGNVELVGTN